MGERIINCLPEVGFRSWESEAAKIGDIMKKRDKITVMDIVLLWALKVRFKV